MLKTFKIGGIHPPENKLTSGGKIQKLPVPEQVIITLGQHIGAPASPDLYLPMYIVPFQELSQLSKAAPMLQDYSNLALSFRLKGMNGYRKSIFPKKSNAIQIFRKKKLSKQQVQPEL